MIHNKENIIASDKLDELLVLRESKKNALKTLNELIKQGIAHTKKLPDRWYVRNPNKSVIDYLNEKYKSYVKHTNYDFVVTSEIGYGERYGELITIPRDVDYSWEITNEEFEYALKIIQNELKK